MQGKSNKAPPYEKVLAHFLTEKKGPLRDRAGKFSARLCARTRSRQKIRLHPTNGLFWPEREAKSESELRLMRKALEITEAGMARGIEVLKRSKPGKGQKLRMVGCRS